VTAPGRPTTSHGEDDLDTLRARYAETELKRKRAEALADGLAQRVAQLEAELRGRASTADARRAEQRIAELEARLAESETSLVAAQSKLVLTESALVASEATTKRLQGEGGGRAELELRLASTEQKLTAALAAAEERGLRASEAELRASALEKRLGTVQGAIAELDQALRRERAKVAEIESSQRRVQAAAVTSARDVLARLARHESKLSSLRKEALSRAVALLDEAGAVHGGDIGIESRLTPPVPARSAGTDSPSARRTAPRLPTGITADALPTPIRGTHRSGSGPRRTVQGIAPVRSDELARPNEPVVPPKRQDDDDPEIEISVDES
jgi:hypothetical protein